MADEKKKFWRRWWHVVLAIAITIALLPLLVGERCPKSLTIATASSRKGHRIFAEEYREFLAKRGIELIIRETQGSVQNVELLTSPDEDVSLAIVQGGISTEESRSRVRSLASVAYDPLWVFYRGPNPVDRLSSLASKRVAVDQPDTDTRALAITLLQENGVGSESLVDLSWSAAADGLKAGDIDAAMFLMGAENPLVAELLATQDIHLMSFQRSEAYSKRYPYLSPIELTEGFIDLQRNLPGEDHTIIATTATLVAREDLHPVLVPLLLRAAELVHDRGGVLEAPGEFPSPHRVDFPLSEDARQYFQSGPSFLYRVLPFQLAARIDQIKLLAIPLITILLPLGKLFPVVYRWRIRSKIIRWYRILREIDQKLEQNKGAADYSEEIARLRRLEIELAEVSVPLGYMEEFYNMRLHVTYVMDLLEEHHRPPEKHDQRQRTTSKNPRHASNRR